MASVSCYTAKLGKGDMNDATWHAATLKEREHGVLDRTAQTRIVE
jgi:hypothetical protein